VVRDVVDAYAKKHLVNEPKTEPEVVGSGETVRRDVTESDSNDE
jgi:hypothetical protein